MSQPPRKVGTVRAAETGRAGVSIFGLLYGDACDETRGLANPRAVRGRAVWSEASHSLYTDEHRSQGFRRDDIAAGWELRDL